jgi:hypothetical protein
MEARKNWRGGWEEHDVLLSVSECGELAFWVPEAYCSSGVKNIVNGSDDGNGTGRNGWRCTGRVRTERKGFNRARCSSAKKTALGVSLLAQFLFLIHADRIWICIRTVVPLSEGHELTIWDSKESEFASGLEYCGVFE